jgi:hypothetical protein
MAAIQVEIWVKYIIENLFKNNAFLNYCYNDDQYVVGGKVVHIPQAGARPTVVKNRSIYPASVDDRIDTIIDYVLDEYTTNPIRIPQADQVELSYDKMTSVLSEIVSMIKETVSDNLLYNWAPTTASGIIRTTGVDVGSGPAARKKFVKENLKSAKLIMDLQKLPSDDRYALVDANMYDELMDDSSLQTVFNLGYVTLPEGVINRLYGFNLMMRSDVITYDNSATPVPKAPGSASATDDNVATLCWQKDQVARALGTVNFFEHLKNPLYFGDIYAALLRMGGRKRRGDNSGIVAIVRDVA